MLEQAYMPINNSPQGWRALRRALSNQFTLGAQARFQPSACLIGASELPFPANSRFRTVASRRFGMTSVVSDQFLGQEFHREDVTSGLSLSLPLVP